LTSRTLRYISSGLLIGGLFAKDLIAVIFDMHDLRNTIGSILILVGLLTVTLAAATDNTTVRSSLSMGVFTLVWFFWLGMAAMITSLFDAGELYITPQLLGFVIAVVSYHFLRREVVTVLKLLIGVQMLLLAYEYFSSTIIVPTVDKVHDVTYKTEQWKIGIDSDVVRAKGMFDSPHKSAWLLYFSVIIFYKSTVFPWLAVFGSWLSLARLPLMLTAIVAISRPYKSIHYFVLLVFCAGISFYFEQRIFDAFEFVVLAFDTDTSSNFTRAEAWQHAMQTFLSRSVPSQLFGIGGGVSRDSTLSPESDYINFLLEYGAIGLFILMGTLIMTLIVAVRRVDVLLISFSLTLLIACMNSALQSASSFFLFMFITLRIVSLVSTSLVLRDRDALK
jgi:hypothetical protein